MTRVQFPVAENALVTAKSYLQLLVSSVETQAVIAQLGERQTEDLEVLGSIPSPGIFQGHDSG